MRIAPGKLLLRRAEPAAARRADHHLDLEARNWLETYLNAYPHAVILVSHDRFFLDAVVTRIADLTLRTLTDYVGTYSDYIVQHEARIDALRKAKHEQDEEVARVKLFIDRFRYQATKASQVQSRIKMLEKIVPIEVPLERKRIHFDFPTCGKSGRTVLELKNVRKAYGDLVVFGHVNLHIERGDRIALVGPNGTGKSTLMRMLSGEEAPDQGERLEGHNVVMQYFAQDEATRMDPMPTVYETLASGSPLNMVPAIHAASSAASCSRETTSTNACGCCRAANARAWPSPACCYGRQTSCSSTSRPTTSTSIQKRCCSMHSSITAAP
jgi:ATP-binding cassette subfamily F protein 3